MRSPNQMIMTAAGRLHGALTDPARRERSVVLLLVVYAVAWTIYGAIAKSSQGLHYDMVEVIAWSRDLAFGYLKHPPLAAWLVRGWFSVFPLTEASYYLLAMLMPALALWIVWRLSADYLDIEKRIFALALLTLVPFYNFQALKFNVNTVLLPLWAATTLWFLRSYRTRSALYAALAGIGAAGCMLGKYWSVVLLAGLALAALIDRRRGVYFRSAAPWITATVGGIVLAPHLVWLVRHHFAPFAYAVGIHGDKPFATALHGVAGYLAGAIGYVALPIIIVVLIILRSSPRKRGPSAKNSDIAGLDSRLRGNERRWEAPPEKNMIAALADMIWPKDNERRLVAAAFWGPLLLPVIGALVSGTEINSLWSMPAWTLLPLLLLSSPAATIAPIDTRHLLAGAMLLPLAMLIAAPVIAIANQRAGITAPSAQSALLAAEIERLWHQATPQPLRFVGGDAEIAYGVVAYAADRPRALPDMPAPDAAALARNGQVLVCDAQSAGCVASAAARAAADTASRQVITDIVRNFFGFPGKPRRYTIFIVPPQG
jgi:4-amino-4-deoxy-L-arabinose transferase-like glycosyltransferase